MVSGSFIFLFKSYSYYTPTFARLNPMNTASSFGSGPRGRRFKSGLPDAKTAEIQRFGGFLFSNSFSIICKFCFYSYFYSYIFFFKQMYIIRFLIAFFY